MNAIIKKSKVFKGELLPGSERELVALAEQLDAEIRRERGLVETSLDRLAKLLTKMHNTKLWQYVPDKAHTGGFRRFEDYIESVLGPTMGRTKIYDLLAIGRLGCGPNPVSPDTIQKLGRIKAAEIARLAPEQRTPEMLKCALEHSVPVVRQRVQETINKTLPPQERREIGVFWGRYYPAEVIDRFEELEARGCYMEGVRCGDASISLCAKFMMAMIINFEANFPEELEEADRYVKAIEARKAEGAARDDCEEGIGPPEPEEYAAQSS